VRILIATPVFQLYSRTVASVLTMDAPDGCERDYVLAQDDDLSLSHYARITAKFNRIRALALAGGYDAMLSVEADMLPPPHALCALLGTGADIAYGVYSFRHEFQEGQWTVAARLRGDGSADWLCSDPTEARRLWGRVVRCEGVGMGCTLIRRHALESLPFRDNGVVHCDWMLGMDAAAAGLSQAAHLGVICGHIRDRERAVWPDPTTETLSREERIAGGY
jgi:hypothetical protein